MGNCDEEWPDGLILVPDFISAAEEAEMISAFEAAEASRPRRAGNRSGSRGGTGRKRLSQHFGFHFDYTTLGALETVFTPVTGYIESLLPRLPMKEHEPDQFTVQKYPPGAGIPPHVDTHSLFYEPIYSLSFGSDIPMFFRPCDESDARRMRLPKRSAPMEPQDGGAMSSDACSDPHRTGTRSRLPSASTDDGEPPVPTGEGGAGKAGEGQAGSRKKDAWELILPRRSLLVMTVASRYGFVHGITARKTDHIGGQRVPRQDRYSLTMRTVRGGSDLGCQCCFPGVCDARIRDELLSGRDRRTSP